MDALEMVLDAAEVRARQILGEASKYEALASPTDRIYGGGHMDIAIETLEKHYKPLRAAIDKVREGQWYVALVVDEPISGLPSQRVYGPFDSSELALDELGKHNLPDYVTTGYLLLRGPGEIAKEVVGS